MVNWSVMCLALMVARKMGWEEQFQAVPPGAHHLSGVTMPSTLLRPSQISVGIEGTDGAWLICCWQTYGSVALTLLCVVICCLFLDGFVLFHLDLFCRDRVSLCSPGCRGAYCVDQTGIKLRIFCLCLPSTGIKSVHHYTWLELRLSGYLGY